MKKSLLILIFLLYAVLLKGIWLPSNVKIRVLYPLYESLKDANYLEISVRSFSSNADTLISSAGNISFSEIKNMQQTNIKSNVIILFGKILESIPLSEKDKYLSHLPEYKEKIEKGLYFQCSNIAEQIYSYRTVYNELSRELPGHRDSIGSMNGRILRSIQITESNFREVRSNPDTDPITLNKIITQYHKLKPKVLGKINLISGLKNILDTKSSDIDNFHKNLIAVLNSKEEDPGLRDPLRTAEVMTNPLYPLYELLKEVDYLEISVRSFSSNADILISSAGNLSFSEIKSIQQPKMESNVVKLFSEILESSPLAEKDKYLSRLIKYKKDMDKDLYFRFSNIIEQLFLYRTIFDELNAELPRHQNNVGLMNGHILRSIRNTENNLKEFKSNLGTNTMAFDNIITQYHRLKSEVLGKTGLIFELKNILDTKSSDMDNLHKNLIARLSSKEEHIPGTTEELTGLARKLLSRGQLQNIQDKAKQIMELSMSLLNEDMQKGIEYLQNNELDKAARIFQKEIIKNPLSWMAHKYLAKIYIKQGKPNKALEEINLALKIFRKVMGIK